MTSTTTSTDRSPGTAAAKTGATALRHLRIVSFLEGLSYVVLLGIAMPLKYFADMPLAVRIVGSIHGALFIAFCIVLLRAFLACKWPLTRAAIAFLAAVTPLAAFALERSLKREQEALRS